MLRLNSLLKELQQLSAKVRSAGNLPNSSISSFAVLKECWKLIFLLPAKWVPDKENSREDSA